MEPLIVFRKQKKKEKKKNLGLIVCRGTAITLICPTDGMTEIANPFAQES